MGAVGVALALGAGLSWAVTQVLMRVGLESMSRPWFALLRTVWGIAFVLPYGILSGGFAFGSLAVVGVATAGGVLNAFVGTALFYYAVTRSPVHVAVNITGSGPFWGVLAAALFLGEPLSLLTVGAAVAVVCGASLLVSPGGSSSEERLPAALLAALATAVLWGFTTAVPAKYCLSRGMTPITYQLVMVVAAGACWGVVALRAMRRSDHRFTLRGVWVAGASSFAGFFLGWILWLTALDRAPASLVSPLMGSTTLFAFLLGVLSFRERPTWRAIAGAAFVIGGVILVSTAG